MRKPPVWILMLTALASCGGEEDDPPPPPPQRAEAAEAARPTAKGGKPAATLTVYRKVEDVVSDSERGEIRHTFRERDFIADPTGTENRDPFRSFVITQVGVGVSDTSSQIVGTDVCPIKKQIARSYSVRDLHLVGIVSRGTVRYALFSDTRGEGHIVHRGDCLGQEKSRVKDIGAGFVTLELSPEPTANQPPRPPEERSIPLYPKELPIGEAEDDRAPMRSLRPPGEPSSSPSSTPRTGPSIPPGSDNRQ